MFKKLITTSYLILVISACGKKVQTKQEDSPTRVTNQPGLSAEGPEEVAIDIVFNAEVSSSYNYIYQAKDSGWVKIPEAEELVVESGDSTLITVLFKFNGDVVEGFANPQNEIFCQYIILKEFDFNSEGIQNVPRYQTNFNKCFYIEDTSEIEVNYVPGQQIPIDQDRIVEIHVKPSQTKNDSIKLNTQLEFEWH